jgi:hypothetical protein
VLQRQPGQGKPVSRGSIGCSWVHKSLGETRRLGLDRSTGPSVRPVGVVVSVGLLSV